MIRRGGGSRVYAYSVKMSDGERGMDDVRKNSSRSEGMQTSKENWALFKKIMESKILFFLHYLDAPLEQII